MGVNILGGMLGRCFLPQSDEMRIRKGRCKFPQADRGWRSSTYCKAVISDPIKDNGLDIWLSERLCLCAGYECERCRGSQRARTCRTSHAA